MTSHLYTSTQLIRRKYYLPVNLCPSNAESRIVIHLWSPGEGLEGREAGVWGPEEVREPKNINEGLPDARNR